MTNQYINKDNLLQSSFLLVGLILFRKVTLSPTLSDIRSKKC
jgi:hypothetical protein